MKRSIKAAGGYTGIFAGTLFALWLLLILSAMIPNEAIRENMARSAQSYSKREAFEFAETLQLNSVADHYADAIWLNIAWNMGTKGPVAGSVLTSYYDGEELGENAGLYYTVAEGAAPNTDYTRYWHGTAMTIRTLSLFTDVEGIKAIGFAVFLLGLALSVFLLVKRRHWTLAVLLALAFAAVRIWNIRLSMEYQPSFVLTVLLIPLYLLLERRGDRYLTGLSVAGGVLVAFFDFLTTETVTILLPLALVIAVRGEENRLGSFRQEMPLIIRCGGAWGMAYIGTFLAKWTAASIATGGNAFAAALTSAGERMAGGADGFAEKPESFLSALFANLTMLFGGPARVDLPRMLIGTGIAVLALLSVWYLFHGKAADGNGAPLLCFLGSVVFLRYLVLNNHSYLHCFFTYRAMVVPIFAALAAVWLNIRRPRKKGGRR